MTIYPSTRPQPPPPGVRTISPLPSTFLTQIRGDRLYSNLILSVTVHWPHSAYKIGWCCRLIHQPNFNLVSKKLRTTLQRVLSGQSDANIRFNDLISLLLALGFEQRIRGDHHILWKSGIPEIINLQPIGNKAKRYQVKQVRGILSRYRLRFENE